MSKTIKMNEVKRLINYTIDNNLNLQSNGKTPIAVCLEAVAGIGKTSILEQVAQERGMTYSKISLHELEEVGDLVGMPIIEYECQLAKRIKKEDGTIKMQILPNTVWLSAKQMDAMDKSTAVRQTGKTRMGYAKPSWVPEYNENGTLVVLDDYGRATSQLLQACMELIYTQKYVSWSLPKKTSIFLTSNPDDGTYNINTQDEAQTTRFLKFNLEFSEDAWSEWAEKDGMDGRCINFVMMYSKELFSSDEEGNHICNPRSFSMFANMISGLKDWDDPKTLGFINTLASGCFQDEQDKFSRMFTAFLRNKMHVLIQPKDMLEGSWDRVKSLMESCLYDTNGAYRPDISSLLERRFVNYINAWLDTDGKTPINKVKDRILDFIETEDKGGKRLFNKDLFYHMIKTLTSGHKNQTNKLLFEPKIAEMIS